MAVTIILLVLAAISVFLAAKYRGGKNETPTNLPKGGTPTEESIEDKPSRTPKKRDTPIEK
jgi:hypothetical protein